ncbi:MAG TPA: glycosyltransferase [Ktedonobacterales bacterium]|jgi:O-antigen/teichoic acid export membrane protein/glycosyltransferase involved in cell wall biosynthesis
MVDNKQYATQAQAEAAGAALPTSRAGTAAARGANTPRGRSLTHEATIRLGGRLTKIAAGVIAFGLAARALSGDALGIYVTAFAFIQLFNTVANFGVDRILIRDLAQPERESGSHVAFTHATVTSRLLIALGICGLCATTAVVVGYTSDQLTAILLFLPYILISAFGSNGLFGSVLQARNDNNSIALASIVSAVVVILGSVAAIAMHAGVNVFLGVFTLSSLADTVICAVASRRFVPWGMSWSGPLTRYLLAESWPLAIGSAFVLIYGRIDIILLGKLADPDPRVAAVQVATYGVAYKFFDVLSTISATIMIVLFPALARAYAVSSADSKRLYSQVFTLMAAIALPLAFSVLVFHQPLLTILAGHGYAEAAAALPGLMLAIALIFPSSVASYMLVVVRQQRWNLPMAVVASILNIGLNVLLIPRFGFVAAAWITAITEGFVIIFNLTAVARTSGLFPAPRNILLTLLAATPFALILLPGALSYVGGVLGIALFAVLLVVFGVVRPAQVRALISSPPAASARAEETAEAEMEEVLPALAYVAQSDQPSVQLGAVPSHPQRASATTHTWETTTQLQAIRSEDLLEPPRDRKRRQVTAYFGGALLLAGIVTLCLLFLPAGAGVKVATVIVLAAMLCLVAVRPQWALFIFVLALPLHNFLMALLFHATGDATFVKLIQPWKEIVLAVALLRAGVPTLLGWLRTRRLRLTMLDALILLFVGVCLVSVALPSHSVTLAGRALGFRQLALPFAAYFLGRLAVPTRRDFRWLVGAFAVIALVCALGALGEWLFWGGNLFAAVNFGGYDKAFFGFSSYLPHNMGTTFFTGTPGWLPRAGSIVMNPIDLATLLTVSLPIVLAALPFFTRYSGWPGRVLLSAAALVGGVAIFLAFTRTNLLLFPVEVALLVLIIGFRRQWAGALLAGLGYLIGVSLFEQTSGYVLAGQTPDERVARALQGLLPSGAYTVFDVVVPMITLGALAGVVVAIIGATRALMRRRRRAAAMHGLAGAVAIGVLAVCLLSPPLLKANETGILAPLTGGAQTAADAASGDNTSTQGHLRSYLEMAPFIVEHPLGNGIGSAGFVGVRQGTGQGTESAYLPVGAQLGFVGLLPYLAIFMAMLVALWKASRARLDRLTRAVFVGALAAWAFVLIDGLITEVTLNFFVLYVMFWLIGSAVSLARWTKVSWDASTETYQAARPLRIAMDTQCLHTARTGVRTYVTRLLDEFAQNDMPHVVVPISGPKGLPRANVVFRVIDQVIMLAWLHLFLPLRLAGSDFDVLFSPEYLTPIWTPIPCVVTYHDSAFLRRPQDYNRLWQLMFRMVNLPAIRRADAIVVPSRFTMNEAIRYAKCSPGRVHVTPLGGPQPGSMRVSEVRASETLGRFGLARGSYFLHVGVLERRKNLPLLVEAFEQALAHGLPETIKLALVGQPGPRPDLNDEPAIRALIERLGLHDRVVLTGHLSRDEVDALLVNAFAYVLPSKSEGFGLPVLEAFAADIPLACSTAGALPEVAGASALLFDPDDMAQLVECLTRLGGDSTLRQELVRAGTARARLFTWRETALRTMATFEAAVVHSCAPTNPSVRAAFERDSRFVRHKSAREARSHEA